jgi:hypothetical protein
MKVNSKKKTPGKPKGKTPKSVPPSKTRAGLRPGEEKQILFKVGRTYEDRTKDRLKVISIDNKDDGYPILAIDKKGIRYRFTSGGKFWKNSNDHHEWDLIAEVKRRGK